VTTEVFSAPFCPTEGHGQYVLKSPGTAEQAWCGTWYGCQRCHNSILLPSPALEASLAAQGGK